MRQSLVDGDPEVTLCFLFARLSWLEVFYPEPSLSVSPDDQCSHVKKDAKGMQTTSKSYKNYMQDL